MSAPPVPYPAPPSLPGCLTLPLTLVLSVESVTSSLTLSKTGDSLPADSVIATLDPTALENVAAFVGPVVGRLELTFLGPTRLQAGQRLRVTLDKLTPGRCGD